MSIYTIGQLDSNQSQTLGLRQRCSLNWIFLRPIIRNKRIIRMHKVRGRTTRFKENSKLFQVDPFGRGGKNIFLSANLIPGQNIFCQKTGFSANWPEVLGVQL